ncbi:DnaJ homolog subfamily B member 13, partial [Linum grandiflorum]
YDVLSDTQKRQIYDLYGEEDLKTFDFPAQDDVPFGDSKFRFNPRDAENIFAEFFVGSGRKGNHNQSRSHNQSRGGHRKNNGESNNNSNNKKAPAIESKLACRLDELYKGTRRKMKISRNVPDEFGLVSGIKLLPFLFLSFQSPLTREILTG